MDRASADVTQLPFKIEPSEILLRELAEWVKIETPSSDPAAVGTLMDKIEAELDSAGAAIDRVRGLDGGGDNLIARTKGNGQPVLVCCHFDTVWAHGTLTGSMPFRVEGDRAYGPGILDMKAGAFLAFYAFRKILAEGIATTRPITLLFTPDEEIGSHASRWVIEREAANAAAVLIPEPATAQSGACCTARKGLGMFEASVTGRAAHAGVAWSDGRSATVALADLILRISALSNPEEGTTTNIAPIWGGVLPNIIADSAGCKIDLRVETAQAATEMEQAIRALAYERDGVRIDISGSINRPPMVETPETLRLYEVAKGFAAAAGFDLKKSFRGGVSDGNFTAALGVPTLDGLGCTGAGAHTTDEHILWRDLSTRGNVLGALMARL
ncbi:M20 family metallopeptidase [Mesorhizobium sp. RMAD-H1]|uniref:M20 family metallopeptidase n=1 Tax=Mesorhizobium sp. RMAD-H1 TaxID=2587065 RepID=UPI0018321EC0|nr:M20 family metallopeptidase [Mesorhizobium sp. RMAD-H1]MBB2972297.1 glutamate carboxypeptidase [Mesorhizobium sp. RMAD-H1]